MFAFNRIYSNAEKKEGKKKRKKRARKCNIFMIRHEGNSSSVRA